eukprot:4277147-Ditylum_brightwellii.AAC.1
MIARSQIPPSQRPVLCRLNALDATAVSFEVFRSGAVTISNSSQGGRGRSTYALWQLVKLPEGNLVVWDTRGAAGDP